MKEKRKAVESPYKRVFIHFRFTEEVSESANVK